MIDFTIVFSIVVAIAIYKVLEIFSDYLALKIHSYRFKKRLSKLEYKYESWLGADWDDCDDYCDICDEMDEPVKKPAKKTAAKKKTR
jgi:hypothetical protein